MKTPESLYVYPPNALARLTAYVSTGRFWAYVGLVLGAVGSLAANVRHTYLPPEGAPVDWTPGADALAAAVFWPIALFVGLEVMARSNFAAGWRGVALRALGVGPVTLVAGIASYLHLSGLLRHLGEVDAIVYLGPLGVDGLMLMCSAMLTATAKRQAVARVAAGRLGAHRPYTWAVPAGARMLPIVPNVAPAPAPVARPRVAAWVTAPRSARRLPIIAKTAPTPAPVRPVGWLAAPRGARRLPIIAKAAPVPAPVRVSGFVTVPATARPLPVVPRVPAPVLAPAPAPRPSGWVRPAVGAKVLAIVPKSAPAPTRPHDRKPANGKRPLAETKRLAEEIMREAREKGEKITQQELAAKLSISRWTLRDALALTPAA
ncbi:hypothetical protein [Micromonospora sp. NPDC047730]|uniref:hypothetical protein n=1 Tax=Micromonospora sp. NPDC047730 TaxID=3364253 RepID=UPI003715308B